MWGIPGLAVVQFSHESVGPPVCHGIIFTVFVSSGVINGYPVHRMFQSENWNPDLTLARMPRGTVSHSTITFSSENMRKEAAL
jgi:hypothetical protein